MAAEQLEVTIISAQGLKHLNHFTGDHLYAVCEIVHANPHASASKFQTQPLTGSLDPVWNETQTMQGWIPGEALKITISDKGLLGSMVEGTTELPSEYFEQQGFEGTLPVEGLEHATVQVRVVPLGAPQQAVEQHQVAPQHLAAPAQQHHAIQHHHEQAAPGGQAARLRVTVVHASGLHHMNHFCADKPYCVCEVNHADKRAKSTKIQTKPVTMAKKEDNAEWNEEHVVEPWNAGEELVFTVYDKGLMGSKVEAKCVLPSEYFWPTGFQGEVPFEGLPEGLLFVSVVPEDPSVAGPTAGVSVGQAQQFVQHDPLAQLRAQLPPNARIVGEPRFSHTTYGAPPQAQPAVTYAAPQAMTYAAPQTVSYAPRMQPQTMTYPAPPTMNYGAPRTMTYAAPQTVSMAPQMTYAAPQTGYGAPVGSVAYASQTMTYA